MKEFVNSVYDEERALYGVREARISGCTFAGPADGESALKEAREIEAVDCDFQLRYPLWHVSTARLTNCTMSEDCRAAMWYDRDFTIDQTRIHGIKALRECENVTLRDCGIVSAEFGWRCGKVQMDGCSMEGEYPFLFSHDLEISGLHMKGKYSFQYVENAVIRDSVLDTKDAFWHSRNVTVVDSVIKGEYLAWYSENLHLVRCKIIGTQPLCYAKGLVLTDCEMEGTDLSFEYSQVDASVKGHIMSVKNPLHGKITADSIGEIILDENRPGESDCEIIVREG